MGDHKGSPLLFSYHSSDCSDHTMRIYFFSCLLLLGSMGFGWSELLAQKAVDAPSVDFTYDAVKAKYPDEEVLFLNRNERLDIDFVEGEWKMQRQVNEEILYLSESASLFSQRSIPFSSFEEIEDVKASTLIPTIKGKKLRYVSFPVENIETKDVMDDGIFYSDHKEKAIVFPAMQEGAVTQLSYTEQSKEPHLLSAFYFGSYSPVEQVRFELSFPEHVQIDYDLMGMQTERIKFDKKKDGDRWLYTWTAEELDKVEREPMAPNVLRYLPHLVVRITEATKEDGDKVQVLHDVSGLYAWYSELVQGVNSQPDPQLQSIVADLTEGVNDEREKVKRIFQWVQNNVKYVAFEDGLGGFIPREAKDVCSKRYGDCKDMSSILVTMLKEAGIPAYMTWIGTRDRHYNYEEVPSPVVDNHMIAATKLDGEYLFLDATGDFIPFGFPTSMIQSKDALIGLSADEFHIEPVPVIEKEKSQAKDVIHLSINERDLIGKGVSSRSGFKKVFAEYDKMRADADDNEQFYDEFLRMGNNKFTIEKVESDGFFERDKDLVINYDLSIPGYATKAGDKYYIDMNLRKKYKNSKIDLEKRKLDREYDYKFMEQMEVRLDIPEGYGVNTLPANLSHEGELFGFTQTYSTSADGKQVVMKQDIYINHLILEKQHFPNWNKMIEQLNTAYGEVLVLEKK